MENGLRALRVESSKKSSEYKFISWYNTLLWLLLLIWYQATSKFYWCWPEITTDTTIFAVRISMMRTEKANNSSLKTERSIFLGKIVSLSRVFHFKISDFISWFGDLNIFKTVENLMLALVDDSELKLLVGFYNT